MATPTMRSSDLAPWDVALLALFHWNDLSPRLKPGPVTRRKLMFWQLMFGQDGFVAHPRRRSGQIMMIFGIRAGGLLILCQADNFAEGEDYGRNQAGPGRLGRVEGGH
jgi:hypothetical protein